MDDPLTAVLRAGARRLLEQAIKAEVETFLAAMNDLKLPDGRDRGAGSNEDRIRFTSAILPAQSVPGAARRTKSLDALLPVLYLRGISRKRSALCRVRARPTCRRR